MQTNFSDKSKSHLIKLTETKKNKARRRLIGSVFLLVVALVILLKVTCRVTPIDEPKSVAVEIKNTSPVASKPSVASKEVTTISEQDASSPAKDTSSNIVAVSKTIASNTTKMPSKIIASEAVNSKIQVRTQESSNKPNITQPLKPRIITETPKLSPDDILNGQSNKNSKPIYYVQLIASSDKNKLIQMQNNFANKGIKTIIQSVDTPKGTVYRLRVGPLSNQMDAENMLKDINKTTSDE